MIGSRLAEFAGRALENLSYGHTFGPPALGAYTLANQISRFLCESAGNPLWGSLYAHTLREDGAAVRPLHIKLTRLLALILFPVAALITASAPQVFALALGPKWSASTALVQVMLPFYALNTVAGQCGAILLAKGRSAALFWTLGALSAGRLAAVLAGPWIDVPGVAWGIGAANVLFAAGLFGLVGRTTGSRPGTLLRTLLAPAAAGVAGAAVCHAVLGAHPEGVAWTAFALGAGGSAYLGCLLILEGRQLLADASALRRIVFPSRAVPDRA